MRLLSLLTATEPIEGCHSCGWPIAGPGPHSWMAGTGPFRPPKYCGQCGHPFPWTETALEAAKEYTDDLEQLTAAEKILFKETLDDLTRDTPRTPLAANRFKRLLNKIGPVAGSVLQKLMETVVTEAVKKSMGL
jgi:hypothetical protein